MRRARSSVRTVWSCEKECESILCGLEVDSDHEEVEIGNEKDLSRFISEIAAADESAVFLVTEVTKRQ